MYKENTQVPDNFFLSEARGLSLLAELAPEELHVPRVHAVLPGGILMERLHNTASDPSLLRSFGRALALLHRESANKSAGLKQRTPLPFYGLGYDNYLGLTVPTEQSQRQLGQLLC